MKNRVLFLYIIVAIIPLLIMDVAALGAIVRSEKRERIHEMENAASAIQYTLANELDSADKLTQSVYTNKYIYDFIDRHYQSGLEYYEAYYSFFEDTLIDMVDGANNISYTFYVDNDSIINGAQFQRLETAEGQSWYEYIMASGRKLGLMFDYGGAITSVREDERRVYFYEILDMYDHRSRNLLLVNIDYSYLSKLLQNTNYDLDVYVCDDEKILMSNKSEINAGKPYESIKTLENIGYVKEFQAFNQQLTIRVANKNGMGQMWISRWGMQLLFLVIINILLPIFVISRISRFVYSYRLREQEMIVTRQHAELHALHSQINPHFLFNALESIRMHSIIKQETETAEMVEKLAKLQRQYTEWNEDNISIEKELSFAENYLGLQKYRFGDRLSYSIEADDDCRAYLIPKLTLVTFVENACIHGIENKNKNGWIFVRIFKKDEKLIIEIEDTGSGMSAEETETLLHKMRDADMELLNEPGRVGIVNACLRLKMMTDNTVEFELESEESVGTIVSIAIPIDKLIS
ncbi:sensor histidine kinase [Butyrivibrio sp. AD3002]|uniref:sensor histidine kinase n=1 Tax=Butyrivibrio sp. AD3002 TaxID=1280670 RepID=UPI0003B66277|nr:histidine kinase [Butyrivibrio sp. AD3002]